LKNGFREISIKKNIHLRGGEDLGKQILEDSIWDFEQSTNNTLFITKLNILFITILLGSVG